MKTVCTVLVIAAVLIGQLEAKGASVLPMSSSGHDRVLYILGIVKANLKSMPGDCKERCQSWLETIIMYGALIDANDDDVLTLEEILALGTKASQKDLTAWFEGVDTNGDGKINWDEYLTTYKATLKDGKGWTIPAQLLVAYVDRNHDKYIDIAEQLELESILSVLDYLAQGEPKVMSVDDANKMVVERLGLDDDDDN